MSFSLQNKSFIGIKLDRKTVSQLRRYNVSSTRLVQVLICTIETVIGNEILDSQALSNNAQTTCIKESET